MGEPALKIKPWWEKTAANDPVIAGRHPGIDAAIIPDSYTPNPTDLAGLFIRTTHSVTVRPPSMYATSATMTMATR